MPYYLTQSALYPSAPRTQAVAACKLPCQGAL